MSNSDVFYVFGIALAVSAMGVSLFGLRSPKFPGRALPLVVLWFAILLGVATTFAVLHARDEEQKKAATLSQGGREIAEEERNPPTAAPPP